ncbi:MAG: peptide chain release factor N(5)-glutamine methyltransferase [Firmicutes bacterium]|nr:peptide chain release factor N(5)-glutamine methyltransferase [Bacillota bacterium]
MNRKLWTAQELINLSTDYLQKYNCLTPRLDAEVLLAHVLDTDRLHLYMNLDYPLEKIELDMYRRLIGQRGQRIPVAYLIGYKEFYTKEFIVSRDVIVPRPETEILVDQAVKTAQNFQSPRILELGTGSGIIAISIALSVPQSWVLAVDISDAALEIAAKNADRLAVVDQLSFLKSDMFSRISSQKFDIICSNPPYISTNELDNLDKEIQFEPRTALDGGEDGLKYHRVLINNSPDYLISGGSLIIEIGFDQAEQVVELGKERGFSYDKTVQDYAGKDRVVIFKWK